MAHNNDALYDAVVVGAGGGAQHGWLVLSSPASYTPFATNIDILATAVDLQIPAIAGGPSISQINLLQSITQSVLTARYPVPVAPATYIDIAKAIAAVYVELEKLLTNQPDVASYGVNWLVPDWYIDGTVGDDANSGVVIGAPLKTGAELLRRLGPYAMWPQSVTVHVLANGMIDALVLRGLMMVAGTHLDVIGTAIVLTTDTVASYVSLSHAIPNATQLTGATIADWTPYIGKRIRFTDGVGAEAVIWIGTSNPGGAGLNIAQTCRTSRIDMVSTSSLNNVTNIVPGVGSSFVVESLPIIPSMQIQIDGTLLDSAGPQWPVRCCAVQHIDCPQISYDGPDDETPCRSIIFGCNIGTIYHPATSGFYAAFRRVGFHVSHPIPRLVLLQATLSGSYFCGLCTVAENDCEFGASLSLTYVLFQNSRLVPRGGCTLSTGDLQWFDCTSTSAVYSIPVGGNVIQSGNNSGARNAGYGLWMANNTRGRFTGTWNVQAALGQAQLISTPTVTLTSTQILQTSDYSQKGITPAMVAGTTTVTVPWYDNAIQQVTVSHAAFAGTPGILSVQQISTTQFTITSSSALDTSTVRWQISPLGRNIFIATV